MNVLESTDLQNPDLLFFLLFKKVADLFQKRHVGRFGCRRCLCFLFALEIVDQLYRQEYGECYNGKSTAVCMKFP